MQEEEPTQETHRESGEETWTNTLQIQGVGRLKHKEWLNGTKDEKGDR